MHPSSRLLTLSAIAASLLAASPSRACWGELDVDAAVRGADLVVSGQIVAIDAHHLTVTSWSEVWFGSKAEHTSVFDRAHFQVTRLLVGDPDVLAGRERLLALVDGSAAGTGPAVSATSTHSVGEQGIWLFRRDEIFTGLYKLYPAMPLSIERLPEVLEALDAADGAEPDPCAPRGR